MELRSHQDGTSGWGIPAHDPSLSSNVPQSCYPNPIFHLKNYAAVTGGNAADGCGESMPSGEDGTLEALSCSACKSAPATETSKEKPDEGGGGGGEEDVQNKIQ
ncbi:UNVERIFIED_CONTAM: Zinc-finger homeodomain protein 4 [Sesamum radiatum]|uniref:Zinc-finger homeodomain protein 4 n=1 Tax=Sesamum radiatum TaxID=300843 RepID=A0AAW2S404_SESRA